MLGRHRPKRQARCAKEICARCRCTQDTAYMTSEEFEACIMNWARQQPDLEALIQIGSRAQSAARIDEWSDWDYHLIVRNPRRFHDNGWLTDIAPCWCAHLDRTERGILKLSAVFSGGWEVDFVPIAAWQMKLVYWAMARPSFSDLFPRALVHGIQNTQLVVRPGYRVVVGGEAWVRRLVALDTIWPEKEFTDADFRFNVAGFWRHAVWVQKKIMRGETRAALRWHQVELAKRRWLMLEEEMKMSGHPVRPEARQAEKWLDPRRFKQTAIEFSTNQLAMARALLAEMDLFEEASSSVAVGHGWETPDYSEVAAWLRSELTRLLESP